MRSRVSVEGGSHVDHEDFGRVLADHSAGQLAYAGRTRRLLQPTQRLSGQIPKPPRGGRHDQNAGGPGRNENYFSKYPAHLIILVKWFQLLLRGNSKCKHLLSF